MLGNAFPTDIRFGSDTECSSVTFLYSFWSIHIVMVVWVHPKSSEGAFPKDICRQEVGIATARKSNSVFYHGIIL